MAGYTRQSIADILAGEDLTAEPLNAEFNRLELSFGTQGHSHDGTAGNGPKISLQYSVSGILSALNGGTGGKNNINALVNPTATDDESKGYVPGSHWINTSTNQAYILVNNQTGSAIWNLIQAPTGTFLVPGNNLSDLTNVGNARNNLGLAVGSNIQAYNAKLDFISSSSTQDKILYTTTDGAYQFTGLSGYSRNLLSQNSAANWKTNLGLGNVQDTSDLGKPVSTATQTALDGKANSVHTHAIADVTNLQTTLNAKADSTFVSTKADADLGNVVLSTLKTKIGDATTTTNGLVTLASASDITVGTVGKVLTSDLVSSLQTPYINNSINTSSVFFGPPSENSPGTTGLLFASIALVPFFLSENRTVNTMSIRVITAQTGSIRLGVYTSDPITKLPKTLLRDFGVVSSNSTGVKTLTGSSFVVPKGLSYFATQGSVNGINVASGNETTIGWDPTSFVPVNYCYFTQAYGTFPSTFSTTPISTFGAYPIVIAGAS